MNAPEEKSRFELLADFKEAFWIVMEDLGVTRPLKWVLERIERWIK